MINADCMHECTWHGYWPFSLAIYLCYFLYSATKDKDEEIALLKE